MALANRWLGFLHTFKSSQRWGIEYLIMKESDIMGVLVEAGTSQKAA
jgi:hypothetical protein